MTDSFAKIYENLQRQSFRMTINKVWNTIEEGHSVELSQENQKLYQILLDHQEYQEYFRATFPSDNCQGLTGCDLGAPQGQLAFREGGVKQTVCLPVVQAATAQVLRILADHQGG